MSCRQRNQLFVLAHSDYCLLLASSKFISMMLNRLKIFPFHIFLIPIFFIWHATNGYFGLIPLRYIAAFLACYLLLALILFLTGQWIFKNRIKAGCWTSIILIIFFFWGAGHDFLRSLHLPVFFTSYTFLLPFVFILLAVITWKFGKSFPPLRLSRFFSLLFCLFLVWEGYLSASKLINKQYLENNLAYHNQLHPAIGNIDNTKKPDIFFIVFDEFASTQAIQKYLGYDNSILDSMLARRHFFVIDSSKSNYNFTTLSFASILNLDYIKTGRQRNTIDPLLGLKCQVTIKKNIFQRILEDQGYRIINRGLFDLEAYPCPQTPILAKDMINVLYLETLWGRLMKELFWQLREKKILGLPLDPGVAKSLDFCKVNIDNYQETYNELGCQDNVPKFVFAHFMFPHYPFCYDGLGNKRADPYATDTGYDDSLYIDQVRSANKWVDSLAGIANRPFQRPRVVLMMGDHGYRADSIPDTNKQFMNFSTIYFSDNNYSQLYKTMSPVNSLRVVLNKYFGTALPVLKDSSILFEMKESH